MSKRSAEATIKGFLYQFDHTILSILDGKTPQSSVIVEGIEDIDFNDGNQTLFIQCKYYEGTSYNHSLIKKAIIQMLEHFHAAGCPNAADYKYRIYGHYKNGQEKLPLTFNLEFLKNKFLTIAEKKIKRFIYDELSISDTQLENFKRLLEIDINAVSYDEQQINVVRILRANISGASSEDVEDLIYPCATQCIQSLAIRGDISKRKITKRNFLTEVNRKEVVLERWLRLKFGQDYYINSIRKKYFSYPTTKIPKSSRFFVISVNDDCSFEDVFDLVKKVANKYSHNEHRRTAQGERFCPYFILLGLPVSDRILLKQKCMDSGMHIKDGYPFKGSVFSPQQLVASPTSCSPNNLNIIQSIDDLKSVVAAIDEGEIVIYDFYEKSPIKASVIPPRADYHRIEVEGIQTINRILRL